jgi:8-oxo-dGTP pyrophosphatase MutT (NUDIX family)
MSNSPAEEFEQLADGVTVTFEVRCNDKFLFVRRPDDEENEPGKWCFPGGKVRAKETLPAAVFRELDEEVGIKPTGRLHCIDSYRLGTRVGAHFIVEVADDIVRSQEFEEYKWIQAGDNENFLPRINGIDNHVEYSDKRFTAAKELKHFGTALASVLGAVDRLLAAHSDSGDEENSTIRDLRQARGLLRGNVDNELTPTELKDEHSKRVDALLWSDYMDFNLVSSVFRNKNTG